MSQLTHAPALAAPAQTDTGAEDVGTPDLKLIDGGLQEEASQPDEFDLELERAFAQADAAITAPDTTRQHLEQSLKVEEAAEEKLRGQLKQANIKLEDLEKRLSDKEKSVNHFRGTYGPDSELTKSADAAAAELRASRDVLLGIKERIVGKIAETGRKIDDLRKGLSPQTVVVVDVKAGMKEAAEKATAADRMAITALVKEQQAPKRRFVLDLQGFCFPSGQANLVAWVTTLIEGVENREFPESFALPRSLSGAGPKVKVTETRWDQETKKEVREEVEIPHYKCGLPDAVCKHSAGVPNRFAVMVLPDQDKPVFVALCVNAISLFKRLREYFDRVGRQTPPYILYTAYPKAQQLLADATERVQRAQANQPQEVKVVDPAEQERKATERAKQDAKRAARIERDKTIRLEMKGNTNGGGGKKGKNKK